MQAHVPLEEPESDTEEIKYEVSFQGPELVSEWGREAQRALCPVEKGSEEDSLKNNKHSAQGHSGVVDENRQKQAQWQVEIKLSYYGTVKWCIHRDLLLFDRELFWSL